ncbi:MAG: hemerythrin domain-containing protein [Deltaproteobacteria bacterium]|nr:hemerythrin domain-containing protein [Deltaproteobacteria bacterium]
MSHPIDDLEHGHEELGALLLELRALHRRAIAGEIEVDEAVGELTLAADALKDAMAIHFSREGEALFPFVEARVPSLVTRAESLAREHDLLCTRAEEVSRTCAGAGRAGLESAAPALERLENLYAGHAASERAFLGDLRAALDDKGRDELRQLLLGL